MTDSMTAYIVLATVLLGFATLMPGIASIESHGRRLWRFLGIDDDRSGL